MVHCEIQEGKTYIDYVFKLFVPAGAGKIVALFLSEIGKMIGQRQLNELWRQKILDFTIVVRENKIWKETVSIHIIHLQVTDFH